MLTIIFISFSKQYLGKGGGKKKKKKKDDDQKRGGRKEDRSVLASDKTPTCSSSRSVNGLEEEGEKRKGEGGEGREGYIDAMICSSKLFPEARRKKRKKRGKKEFVGKRRSRYLLKSLFLKELLDTFALFHGPEEEGRGGILAHASC